VLGHGSKESSGRITIVIPSLSDFAYTGRVAKLLKSDGFDTEHIRNINVALRDIVCDARYHWRDKRKIKRGCAYMFSHLNQLDLTAESQFLKLYTP
jgi:hypothetical protein